MLFPNRGQNIYPNMNLSFSDASSSLSNIDGTAATAVQAGLAYHTIQRTRAVRAQAVEYGGLAGIG